MPPYIPVTLVGENLGKRHNYLNGLVNNAYKEGLPFEKIQDVSEVTPVDRLFKIDLANKYKNVDFIVKTLKDEDLLYVSRALKCTWLLDSQYSDIINPFYLEDTLYPVMLTTAVNKMKHWVQLNLKDARRNQEFYNYYKHKKDYDAARKYLLNCSAEYIFNEVTVDMLCQFSLKYLKVISEKCPNIIKIYYDELNNNSSLLSHYLDAEERCFNTLKKSLKTNTEVYLDFMEKYFSHDKFQRMSPEATKYIMKYHKTRFLCKPELYTAWLLDIKTLSKLLNNEEIKDIILQLAKAEYLSSWFSYKNIEPLLKTMSVEDSTKLKQIIFVEKSFGDKVKTWPYQTPCSPEREKCEEDNVFSDVKPLDMGSICQLCSASTHFKKQRSRAKTKTLLDKLFDRYRVASFKSTFHELRKQIITESSAQNREYMMLVLVSKSGGQADQVEELLRWLVARHINEPVTIRAAVVRSLVKRAAVWRLPDDAWRSLLQFATGLGLDGLSATAICREGLHAVVLRDLLLMEPCRPIVFIAYLQHFSTLTEYSLNSIERRCVRERLPALLLSAATLQSSDKPTRLMQLLDTLSAYRLRLTECNGSIEAITMFAHSDPSAACPLLQRIFNSRDARKELFQVNFKLLAATEQSYTNALRHNVESLSEYESVEALFKVDNLRYERFFRKLAIYFAEKSGLATVYLQAIQTRVYESSPQIKYARPFALLSGSSISALLAEFDSEPRTSDRRRFAASLRANGHVARPALDINAVGWRSAGAKAVANRVTVCAAKNALNLVPRLLEWGRTTRLALMLAERVPGTEASTFAAVATMRPTVAIRASLKYFKGRGEECDPKVWSTVKPLIQALDLARCIRPNTNWQRASKYMDRVLFGSKSKLGKRKSRAFSLIRVPHDPVPVGVTQPKDKSYSSVYNEVRDVRSVPATLKPEYLSVVYTLFTKFSKNDEALNILHYITDVLNEMDDDFITNILKSFIVNDLIEEKLIKAEGYVDMYTRKTKVEMLCRYMMLCKNEESQTKKLKQLGEPFFNKVETLWQVSCNASCIMEDFMTSLKYRKAWLDPGYANLLPLFDRITKWIHSFLPIEKYFNEYITLNLTMLFYKSVRHGMKQRPDIFNNVKKANERVDLVGIIFGKYIAYDVEELTARYFPTVRILYQDDLIDYFRNFLNHSDSRLRFIKAFLRGIIGESHNTTNAQFIAAHVLVEKVGPEENFVNNLKKLNNREINFIVGLRKNRFR